MSPTDYEIFSSIPFKFIVEDKSFYIHAALVSKYSKPLDRMINGLMEEAQKGFAVLEDEDQGTFARFTRWIYCGYYEAANFDLVREVREDTATKKKDKKVKRRLALPQFEATLKLEQHPPNHLENEELDYDPTLPFNFGRSKPQVRKLTKVAMEEAFVSLAFAVPEVHSEAPPPRANKLPSEDYTNVFLSHARLCVFAEKYDIQPLKMLALSQLHQTLAIHILYPERVKDVISLLRYVYANTSEEQDNIKEDLRPLLKQYVGYEMDVLVDSSEFKELLEDGGAFIGDFLDVVAQRI